MAEPDGVSWYVNNGGFELTQQDPILFLLVFAVYSTCVNFLQIKLLVKDAAKHVM